MKSENYIDQLYAIMNNGELTQGELAGVLNVSFAALNRWLNGHSVPHKRRLAEIEKLYRSVVGYSSIEKQTVDNAVTEAKKCCDRSMWQFIKSHDRLLKALLLEHTYNSTAIEGSTFSRNETQVVIFDKVIIKNKSLVEHLEITNHAVVLRRILTDEYSAEISEAIIKHIHSGVVQGIREDAGKYAEYQRVIHGLDIMLTHPNDIAEEMGCLIYDWNLKKNKTIKDIAEFHIRFELIHPFGDGNGRVGRLIMVLQCLSLNYPPVIIENAQKAEYYDVLEFAQKKDAKPFILFLIEEMNRTKKIIDRYK